MTNNILIISNKDDITSDFIVLELKKRNISFYRFNTEELNSSVTISLDLKKNILKLNDSKIGKEYDLSLFSAVYYRRPELPIIKNNSLSKGERNLLLNEYYYTLEGIYKLLRNKYWFSNLNAIRQAENKIYQLVLAKNIGFKIPNSIITSSYDSAKKFYLENDENCIIKPIKSGFIEEDNSSEKVIFTSKLESFPLEKDYIENTPTFLQELIFKKCDIRVTVIKNIVFAAGINSQNNQETMIDWRKGENILGHFKLELPDDIKTKCIEMVKTLNLEFGAIDLILTKNGDYIFLEINPNGQWGWIQKQLNYDISGTITNALLNHETT